MLASLGWFAYVLWVSRRMGDLLGGYFRVRRLWGSRFDFGRGTLRTVRRLLPHGTRCCRPTAPRCRCRCRCWTWSTALSRSGFFASKPRFLLPAFPLVRTAKARPWHAAGGGLRPGRAVVRLRRVSDRDRGRAASAAGGT
ncbi:hypothetical protein AB0I77_44355 [Streptomyces sp. NPDC050619]|uniref:hypothetical protein n=1 Tax=Streptomyces sp. NPDC050619 TaxID=3157214 RepID=UPI0034130C7F